MALPRTEVTIGLLEELERFKGLIQPLTPAEWATPSRCTGWTVGDVAAHVIGGMADVAAFRLEGLGTGVEALWHDAWLHGDDILCALGRPSERGDGMKASVSHIADVLTREGWGPAVLALDGLPDFAVNGGPANGSSGRSRFSGDPLAFVLAATGRADPRPLGLDESANIYR